MTGHQSLGNVITFHNCCILNRRVIILFKKLLFKTSKYNFIKSNFRYQSELEIVTEECERERRLLKERLELDGIPAEEILRTLEMEKTDKETEKDEEKKSQGDIIFQDNMVR